MTAKRILIFTLGALVIAAGGALSDSNVRTTLRTKVRLWFKLRAVSAQVKTPPPYTLIQDEFVAKKGQAEKFVGKRITARKSDGSYLEMMDKYFLNGVLRERTRKIQNADGRHAQVQDSVKSKSTNLLSPSDIREWAASFRSPDTDCMNDYLNLQTPEFAKFVRHDVVKVPGTTITLPVTWIDSNASNPGMWLDAVVPSLGCVMVEQHVDFGTDYSDIKLVSLVMGEPDQTLFDIPSDYTEAKPSDQARAVYSALIQTHPAAKSIPADFDKLLHKKDDTYSKHQRW